MFDFDVPISRAGTHAEKYTALERLFGRDDLLPFWVADMEFAAAPVVREALAARAAHPVYGYTSISGSLIDAISAWNDKRYGLGLGSGSVTLVPGVMSGVAAAILALSEPGDAIVAQPPLYPPLMQTVRRNRRQLIENHLIVTDGQYRMDFNGLEQLFARHRPRIMLLCSPHNPVGRVWTREEVGQVVALARQYDAYLISDEIHADIVYPPHVHVSALSLDETAADRIIVLNSASKSFNVAGLTTSYALIKAQELRASFRRQLRRLNLHGVNIFGMVALEAAYTGGEEWLDALLHYLQANRQFMEDTLNRELPGLRQYVPEGTYLYWLDFNSLGLPAELVRERLIKDAGIGLNDGITFSQAADGFWRFNFAVPRTMLEKGLEKMIAAFRKPAPVGY